MICFVVPWASLCWGCHIQGKALLGPGRDSEGFSQILGTPWLWVCAGTYTLCGWLGLIILGAEGVSLSCALGGAAWVGGMENVAPSFWVKILVGGSPVCSVYLSQEEHLDRS